MKEPLDEAYFVWLCGQVGVDEQEINPSRTYWRVLKHLFIKEFVWIIDRDENRAVNAKSLRYEFVEKKQIEDGYILDGWFEFGCSMLELMISLSRDLSFQADGRSRDWFWRLMENLGLEEYNDFAHIPTKRVDSILEDVIWRLYRPNGRGGLFPLRKAEPNQRREELWYQMYAYLKLLEAA